MSEECKMDFSARRKRVERLKRLIVFTLFALMILPLICCVVLLFQISSLNGRMDRLSVQLAELEAAVCQQRYAGNLSDVEVNLRQGAVQGADALPESQPVESVAGDEPADAVRAEPENVAGDGSSDAVWAEPEDMTTEDARRKVYLTFDDGPSVYTDEILDTLARYDVKATFFVVGKEDERSKKAIARIVDEGHTLGMHSYTHKYSELYASEENFLADLEKLQDYLCGLTGEKSVFYRFPGGSSNTVSAVGMQELARCLDERGITFFDWNIASGDGGEALLSAETLVNNSTRNIEQFDTVIILMHDSGAKPTTVKALPAIIEKILAMKDTVILPISEDTVPVQHIHRNF